MRYLPLVALLACSHPRAPAAPATWTTDEVLGFVPADAPYAIAQLLKVPAPTDDHAYGMLDDDRLALLKTASAGSSAPMQRVVAAILAMLAKVPVGQRVTTLGLAPDPRFAVYGDPIYPALRIEVADPVRARAAVHALTAAYGPEIVEHPGDVPYWSVASGPIATVLATVHERDLEVTVVATDQVASRLPAFLANARPAHDLGHAVDVPALLKANGLTGELIALLDTGRAAAALEALPEVGIATPECRADIARLVALAPRIVAGIRAHDQRQLEVSAAIQLPADVIAALVPLRVPMPTLAKDPLATMSVGIDVDAAAAYALQIAAAVHANPFKCPALAPLNELAATATTTLPSLARVPGLRGIAVALDDLQLEPLSYRGAAVVLASNPAALWGALPFVSVVALSPDHPTAIPVSATLVPGLTSAHVGLGPDRLSIGVGDHSELVASEALTAKADPVSPMVIAYLNAHWFAKNAGAAFGAVFERFDDVWTGVDVRANGLVFDMGWTWAP